jgi:wobble nucleotide-excising tRNase
MALRLTPIESLRSRVADSLRLTVGGSLKLSRLANDSAVEKWVDQGRRLHDGSNTCLFCGQVLPDGLIAQLSGHFSAEYEKLMRQLSVLTNEVESAQGESPAFCEASQLYPELQQSYITERDALRDLLTSRASTLSQLVKTIQQKLTQAFTPVSCPDIVDNGGEVKAVAARIELIIQQHNERTHAFEAKRQDAFSKLASSREFVGEPGGLR